MDPRNSLASKILFGRNRMPSPENAESLLDALERRNREHDLAGLQANQFASNPIIQSFNVQNSPEISAAANVISSNKGAFGNILDSFLGGDLPKATKQIDLGLSSPGVASNFGRLSPISSEEKEATMNALNNNFYKQSALASWQSKTAAEKKKIIEKLKGGLADRMSDASFDEKELRKGTAHEKEHTSDKLKAKEIAKDHLAERKDYYTALEKAKIAKLLNAL